MGLNYSPISGICAGSFVIALDPERTLFNANSSLDLQDARHLIPLDHQNPTDQTN
jgi:hypothetical protein